MLIYLHAVEGPENRVEYRKIVKLYFFFWKTGLNIHEIVSILEEGPQPNVIANVTLIPDSNQIITGKDSVEEEDSLGTGTDINHLGRGLVSHVGELEMNDEEDTQPDLIVYNATGDVNVVEDLVPQRPDGPGLEAVQADMQEEAPAVPREGEC